MMTTGEREMLNEMVERAIKQARQDNGSTGSILHQDDVDGAAAIVKARGYFHHSQVRSALNAAWNRWNNGGK